MHAWFLLELLLPFFFCFLFGGGLGLTVRGSFGLTAITQAFV